MPDAPERLFLLDGTALAYRAYFAFMRARLTDRKGRPTGAIYGFVATLLKLIRDENPEHLGVCFDPPGPTFRHERYEPYKATRERMDDDLREQLPILREVVRAFNIPVLEVPGFEADDVLATVAKQSAERGIDCYIVTGDKDLCQCVGKHVRIYNILKPGQDTEILDEAGVLETWGVKATQIADVLALMGDSSDNVPGVPGVGKKTAVKLLQSLGDFDTILAAAAADDKSLIKANKLRERLREHRDLAELSKELVLVRYDVPLDVAFEDLELGERDTDALQKLFKELNFTRLLAEVSEVGSREEEHDYRTVTTPEQLEELIGKLQEAELFAVDTETTGLDPLKAALVGISFSFEPRTGWYIPFNRDQPLLGGGEEASRAEAERVLDRLRPVLEDPSQAKCGQNAKYDMLALRSVGLDVKGFLVDTLIASFCLDPGARQHNLDALALRHFGYRKTPTSELIGTGKKQISMAEVPVETVSEYACEDADFTYRLARMFQPRLESDVVGNLFRQVEMPLMPVLAGMEWEGVRVDTDHLDALTERFSTRGAVLEKEIWELAGEPFKVSSPKQVGAVLFEQLKIQGKKRVRKTKTGYSTDERTLRAFKGHPLVDRLLEYRGVTKLVSTYTSALPKLVNPRTGRIHTSYNQTGAITGRLASSDPNLQNIPIRTAEGREIRKAFVPRAEGWTLLSADYSQIELRILAHISQDEHLCEAFRGGADIHRETAARVFGMAPALIADELRSRAKAINFGIMYGMGASRLAEDTGMTRKEATAFIESYFRAYPAVKSFLEKTKFEARELGYVSTLLGRQRSMEAMYESSDPRTQAAADNVAVNTPIQGSAADIIKVAMLRLDSEITRRKLVSRMILQVHDELVFDVAPGELDEVEKLVREEMEGAYEMSVPLDVSIGHGANWLEAH